MNISDIISEHKSEIIALVIGLVITVIIFVFIIGYKKINWIAKELVKMYSAEEKSYLSKKRLESGIAFIIAESGAVAWLIWEHSEMSTTDFVMWLTPQLFVAGWMIKKIEDAKTLNNNQQPNNNG